ncbi:MAG: hypothetical protein QXS91_02965 [Candidatus Anstonellales archaeon]
MGFGIFRRGKELGQERKEERKEKSPFEELNRLKKERSLDKTFLAMTLASFFYTGFIVYVVIKADEDKRKEAAIQRICENDAQKLESILHELGKRESKENIQLIYYTNNGKAVKIKFNVGELIKALANCHELQQRGLSLDGNTLEVK